MTSLLLTEGNPVVIGLVYFSVHWMTHGISNGLFTPFKPLADYMLGRATNQDIMYNYAAQYSGALSAILLLKPLKAFITEEL